MTNFIRATANEGQVLRPHLRLDRIHNFGKTLDSRGFNRSNGRKAQSNAMTDDRNVPGKTRERA